MNKKVNIDLLTLRTLYSDYKLFLIPVFTILSCLLIFLIFILPQANEFFRSRQIVATELGKLNTLRGSLNALQETSDEELDNRVGVLTSALPAEKNFEAILNALSYSANVSGVILGDFDFSVGSITDAPEAIQEFPFLDIELNLAGGVGPISTFLDTLSKTLPISRVTKIAISQNDSTVNIAFYYKPLPNISFKEDAVISPVSKEGESLISELEEYVNPSSSPVPLFTVEEATVSAL